MRILALGCFHGSWRVGWRPVAVSSSVMWQSVVEVVAFGNRTHPNDNAGTMKPAPVVAKFGETVGLADSRPCRAVGKSRNSGTPGVVGERADRVEHEVQSVDALDPARSAIGHDGLDELGSDEVMVSIDAVRVAVIQQDHRERRVFRPREQERLAQGVDHIAAAGPCACRSLETGGCGLHGEAAE